MRYSLATATLLCGGLALSACAAATRPIGFWSRNCFNADDARQGPWRVYFDDAGQHLAARGRFRQGRETGRWRYYTFGGQLEKTEWWRRQPGHPVAMRYYRETGRLSHKGQARYVNETSEPHFYWFGPWRVYDAQGRLLRTDLYADDHRVATDSAQKAP